MDTLRWKQESIISGEIDGMKTRVMIDLIPLAFAYI